MKEYSEQLQNMEVALDETLGDAWDFTLDPLALQVTLRVPSSPVSIYFSLCLFLLSFSAHHSLSSFVLSLVPTFLFISVYRRLHMNMLL